MFNVYFKTGNKKTTRLLEAGCYYFQLLLSLYTTTTSVQSRNDNHDHNDYGCEKGNCLIDAS